MQIFVPMGQSLYHQQYDYLAMDSSGETLTLSNMREAAVGWAGFTWQPLTAFW